MEITRKIMAPAVPNIATTAAAPSLPEHESEHESPAIKNIMPTNAASARRSKNIYNIISPVSSCCF